MLVGDIDMHPVADGTFRASPAYFGDHARPDGHEDLFTRNGLTRLTRRAAGFLIHASRGREG